MISRSKKGGGAVEKTAPELLPCRFCGHEGEGLQYCVPDGTDDWQAACLACGTHGPIGHSLPEAQYLWNLPVDDHKALQEAKRAARYLRAG